jgi:acyl-CoA thioester hydrolase
MAEKTKITYRVPYADTDQMGVVYYANYFIFFERLRNELIRGTGITYREIEKGGLMFPVIEAFCEYHNAARYDDLLEIHGWVCWLQGSRFKVRYEIHTNDIKLVDGFTIHNTITRDGKPRRVPDYIKNSMIKEAAGFQETQPRENLN